MRQDEGVKRVREKSRTHRCTQMPADERASDLRGSLRARYGDEAGAHLVRALEGGGPGALAAGAAPAPAPAPALYTQHSVPVEHSCQLFICQKSRVRWFTNYASAPIHVRSVASGIFAKKFTICTFFCILLIYQQQFFYILYKFSSLIIIYSSIIIIF